MTGNGCGEGVAAVVLAGGRAERMGGRDKGLLELAGRPLYRYALEALSGQVDEVLINANRNAEVYARSGCTVVADAEGGFMGPLAGMLAGLNASPRSLLLTAPCDSPLLAADYAARMLAALRAADAELAVASDGERLQPVFVLLHRALAAPLQAWLAEGGRKIDRWLQTRRMVEVDFADAPEMFINVNTPADLAELERRLAS